ncbi:MAG: Asp23/Gls24 family envelope stress response protein [Clostridium sp.]|nr:Asp23/Gls24 family envelope stress response protein [Clostridium sp.]
MEKDNQTNITRETGKYDVSGVGTVKISEEVVGVIAGIAATEIDGVSGLNPTTTRGITQVFTGKRNVTKGVKVTIDEKKSTIDIVMSVEYGYNIPEVVQAVQENVMTTVENITGLKVSEVNIMVNNISVKKQEVAGKDAK